MVRHGWNPGPGGKGADDARVHRRGGGCCGKIFRPIESRRENPGGTGHPRLRPGARGLLGRGVEIGRVVRGDGGGAAQRGGGDAGAGPGSVRWGHSQRSGAKLTDEEESRIESLLDWEHPPANAEKAGALDFACRDWALEGYRKKLRLALGEGFSLQGRKILVDAGHGASWFTTPEILRGFGAEVEVMSDRPDGKNINEGCGSEHPEELIAKIREREGWIGLAHDGDADRLVLVDEKGERVDGDEPSGGVCCPAKRWWSR
ncbi:MAG: hypothetical protein EB090_00090 [Verrucomicrobia bacterium]|nr:hypothetical protein [Verrucomicrobiota bacterium]